MSTAPAPENPTPPVAQPAPIETPSPTPTPAPSPAPAPQPEPKEQKTPEAKPEDQKTTDSNYLLKKVQDLENDLHKERSSKKEIKAQIEALELEKAKNTALNKALADIGADYEVPTEKVAELQELVAELKASEELDTKISKLVTLVRQPKGKRSPVNIPGLPLSKPGEKPMPDPNDFNALMDLAKNDPEGFAKAIHDRTYK